MKSDATARPDAGRRPLDASRTGFLPGRVLIIAESANPTFVSVPLEGWSHSTALQRLCGGLIVTQVRNRQAFLDAGLRELEDFVAIDSEWLARPADRLTRWMRKIGLGWTATTALRAVTHYAFDWAVARRFASEIGRGEYALVHRVTPLSPTIPSYFMTRLCERNGVPFVIGPINGGVPWPAEFRSALRSEGEWLSYVRSAYKLLPGYRRTLRTASVIITGSRDTLQQIPAEHRSRTVYIAENGVDPKRFADRSEPFSEYPIRVAFVGRLVPYKGADMMLEALAPLIREKRVEVHIYGGGPQRGDLERLVEHEQIRDGVVFHGWVKHDRLQQELIRNHLFVFPSIREFGGAVVIEAMALGVVPVVVAYGGPGELVTPETGFAIPIGSRETIIEGVRAAVAKIASDPARLGPMREAGMARVAEHFTWDAKARKVLEVYRWVCGDRASNPETDPGFLSHGCCSGRL